MEYDLDVEQGPSDAGKAGRVPYRLWIGVTGHRSLPDDPELLAQVRLVLERLRRTVRRSDSTRGLVGVTSPLAEGADRVVATELLKHELTALEVPLPLPEDDYKEDFESRASTAEFKDLLGKAELVTTMPKARNRPAAYVQVADFIVDRSDVLLALWDGEEARGEGGTADVIETARSRHLPVFWISTGPGFKVTEVLDDGIDQEDFVEIDFFNRARISAEGVRRHSHERMRRWLEAATSAGLDEGYIQGFLDWILPYLTRADLLADRYHLLYSMFGSALFVLAALAVGAAAMQVLFLGLNQSPGWTVGLPWLEVSVLVLSLGLILAAQRLKVHARWISCRELAERCRVAFFLCALGLGSNQAAAIDGIHQLGGGRRWSDRAFEEIWFKRPKKGPEPRLIDALKRFLTSAWIDDQANYYERRTKRVRRRSLVLTSMVALFLVAAMLAAVIHGALDLNGSGDGSAARWLLLLAILLPAVAGAAGGILAQREYELNAERFEGMADRLREVKFRIARARDLGGLAATAEAVAMSMLAEHKNWSDLMLRHSIRVHEVV
jgi:hypothetical protein